MRKKRTSTLLLMKRLRLKLHSIPILINNKLSLKNNSKLCYISYSIPLASIVALLLVFSMATSPDLQTLFFVSDSSSVYAIDSSGSGSSSSEEDDSSNDNTTTLPSATITVSGGSGNDAVDAALGQVTYTSRTVDVSVSDVLSYNVYISGDVTLTPEDKDGVTFTGVNGVKPEDFTAYKWGYAWGEEDLLDSDMTYYTPSSALVPLTTPALTNDSVNFTRKITFAAKFPLTAAAGNYGTKNGITLSLITTPKSAEILWYDANDQPTRVKSNTEIMQNIGETFCKDNDAIKEGYTLQMYDQRDGTPYKIVKLPDGNCWMQENLKLTPGANGRELTSEDTDLAEGTEKWVLEDKWTNNATTTPAMKVGSTSLNANYKSEYGNYYNWCAATAGSCVDRETNTASGSICPRGWRLPTSGVDGFNEPVGDFGGLFGGGGSIIGSTIREVIDAVQQKPYKFLVAGALNYYGIPLNVGSIGGYWSNTASGDEHAYYLSFGNDVFNPSGVVDSGNGYTVRCVADY